MGGALDGPLPVARLLHRVPEPPVRPPIVTGWQTRQDAHPSPDATTPMMIAAALALQSLPFAALVLASDPGNRDVFVVAYTAALGLVLSLIVLWDGAATTPILPMLEIPPPR